MTAIEATNRGVGRHAVGDADVICRAWTRSASTRSTRRRLTRCCSTCASRRSTRAATCRGAVNMPQADLATRLDEIPRDRPILTICQAGMRSLRSAQFLRQQGFEHVATVGAARRPGARRVGRSRRRRRRRAPLRITDSEWAHAGVADDEHAGTGSAELGRVGWVAATRRPEPAKPATRPPPQACPSRTRPCNDSPRSVRDPARECGEGGSRICGRTPRRC